MRNNIAEALRLNKTNFDHIEGQRFYYDPILSWLSLLLHLFLIAGCIFFITISKDENNLAFFAGIIIWTFFLVRMFHKIIFKNPILILKDNQLFYTKSEKWYDLSKCKVYEKTGRYNYLGTLFVENANNDNSIKERYFYIKADGQLRIKLKPFYNN